MAKDGTLRGGPRVGQGRPKKALAEKIENGNPGNRPLKQLEHPAIPDLDVPDDMDGVDMPPVREFMTEEQRNGEKFYEKEIFERTWLWLKQLGCEKLVSTETIEQYAMHKARWIQCEMALSKYGLLGKHPTSNAPIQSPYSAMALNFSKQATQIFYQIDQVVKEHCSVDYNIPTPEDDVMEILLRSRKV